MSAVAPATLAGGNRDINSDPSPDQSPSSFTAVNGKDRSVPLMNGQSDPHASSLHALDSDNGHETIKGLRQVANKTLHITDESIPFEQVETTSTSDTSALNPNKRKRKSSDSHQLSPATSYQALSAPRSPPPSHTDNATPQPHLISTNGSARSISAPESDMSVKETQPPHNNTEEFGDSKSSSHDVPWDNYDSQSHSQRSKLDSSDTQLAQALQREVQSATPMEGPESQHDPSNYSQSQPQQSSQATPKRKRVFSNRTKTGCMTCRRRKKKCDEQHPSCNNCIRGGFPCEGYSVRSTWQKPSHAKAPIPLQSKDRYPEPQHAYIQDVNPQRHDPRIAGPMLPDGSKVRPVSVDDSERTSPFMTSPSGTASRIAYQKGSWQTSNHHIIPESTPKVEYRDPPVINDVSRSEPQKPEYQTSHPSRDVAHNNGHQKHGLPVFQNSIEPRTAHTPRIDPSSYPTQARLALSMEPHTPFEASAGKTEKEKMISGDQYRPLDPELVKERERCKAALWRFSNAGNPAFGISLSERNQLLKRVLCPSFEPSPGPAGNIDSLGPGAIVETPFNCHYGYNINIGEDVLISENCFFADDCPINIGAHTWIGPNVSILSSMAIGSMQERKGSQSRYQGRPVVIAEDCWIGAGCTILPGITLGRGAYIAPGEVVRSHILPYGFQGLKPNYP